MICNEISGKYHSNNKENSNSNSSLYKAIRARIATLGFRPFQQLVLVWLSAKGYRHIRPLGRHSARGRRRINGADFVCEWPGGHPMSVAVQLRYWQTPVQARAVDELRGYMAREKIATGMIVARNEFSGRARRIAFEHQGQPIRLVSRSQLAGSLASHGLGLKRQGGHWIVDEAFFRTLTALQTGSDIRRKPARPMGRSCRRLAQLWSWLKRRLRIRGRR